MLDKKQKRYLGKLAHHYKPIFQVGKDGISEVMLNDIAAYLNKHELMKLSVLSNCYLTIEEAKEILTSFGFEVVQSIGKTIIIYKKSKNALKPIVFEV